MALHLHNLQSSHSTRRKKRLGRGNAAGKGTYAGKGLKGQKARSGGSIRAGFEGGRTPLILQTPKVRGKGFRSIKQPIAVVNLTDLNVFADGEVITVKNLVSKNLVKKGPVKILGQGELKKKLSFKVPVSQSAKDKIEKAGGSILTSEKADKSEAKQEK